MKIMPWFPGTIASPEGNQLKNSTPVYTMRLTTFCDEPGDLLCDQCWTVESERLNHFWYSGDMKSEIKEPVTMTLGEYLAIHLKTITGMNPLWSLVRQDFLKEWRSLPR